MVKGSITIPIVTAIEGFTGESQCLAMLTNPCHRPHVNSSACSSCFSLFSPYPFLLLFFSHLFSPHPFSSPVPLICSLLFTLYLSLSLSSLSICSLLHLNPFSFLVFLFSHLSSSTFLFSCPLSLVCSRHLYSPPSLPFPFSALYSSEREALLFLCCKALLSIAS